MEKKWNNVVVTFLIKGSGKEPYKVTFQKNNEHIYAGCNCAARKGGIVCKHIMNVLDGDITDMVSGDSDDVKYVLQLCAGTRFKELFNEYKSGVGKYDAKYLTQLKKAMVTKPE